MIKHKLTWLLLLLMNIGLLLASIGLLSLIEVSSPLKEAGVALIASFFTYLIVYALLLFGVLLIDTLVCIEGITFLEEAFRK